MKTSNSAAALVVQIVAMAVIAFVLVVPVFLEIGNGISGTFQKVSVILSTGELNK